MLPFPMQSEPRRPRPAAKSQRLSRLPKSIFPFLSSNFALLPLTPLESALTDSRARKSFRIRSYEKTGGRGVPSGARDLSSHPTTAVILTCAARRHPHATECRSWAQADGAFALGFMHLCNGAYARSGGRGERGRREV